MIGALIDILIFFLGWFFILNLIEAYKKRKKAEKEALSPKKRKK